jgi:cytoskeleton protein RodZ
VSIGQTLASARIDAGLSVEQVSHRTRIRQTIIAAIERDDFAACGGDFYARGHIRAFAQVVAVDPVPLLGEFDAERAAAAATAGAAPSTRHVFETAASSRVERRGPNWSAAMGAALVAVLMYGGFQLVTAENAPRETRTIADGLGSSLEESPPGTVPAAEPGQPSTPAPAATSAPPEDAVAEAPRTEVEVVIAATDATSWVRVTGAAGGTLFEGLIEHGETETYIDSDEITVLMGNAGGLELTVNGVEIGSPGGIGDVVTQEFGLEDPATG